MNKNVLSDYEIIQKALDDLKEGRSDGKENACTLTLENRRYFIDRTLEFDDLTDVTLDGSGATLVITEDINALTLRNCNRLTVKNLSIDYDPLHYTQGSIVTIEGDTFGIKIDAGYRDDFENFLLKKRFANMTIHDPIVGGIKDGATEDYEVKELKRPAPGFIEATLSIPYTAAWEYRPQLGDRVCLYQCTTGAINIFNCANTVFDSVNLFSSPGFGIHEKAGFGGTHLKNCKIVPGSKPEGAVERRLLSTLGDATHFQALENGPIIEDCIITNCCDDVVNAHGFFFRIARIDGEDIYLSIVGDEPWNVGDKVNCFESGTYAFRGSAKITEFQRIEGFSTNEDNSAIAGNTDYLKKVAYRIRLDQPISGISVGDDMTDSNRISGNAVVRNCTLGFNRARGVVLKGNNCLIENNKITGCTNAGIMVISELSWSEAGFPTDTVIKNNTITHTCHSSRVRSGKSPCVAAVMVLLDSNDHDFFSCCELRNITVDNNTVDESGAFGIFASNCNGITIRNNKVISPFDRGVNLIASNYGVVPNSGIIVGMSKNIVVNDNVVKSNSSEITQSVKVLDNCSQVESQNGNEFCQ